MHNPEHKPPHDDTGSQRSRGDRSQGNQDQRQNPARTRGSRTPEDVDSDLSDSSRRDTDLQREGNLGNERNRNR